MFHFCREQAVPGFAAVEMLRHILGMVQNAYFETEDANLCARGRKQGPKTVVPPRSEPQPHSQHNHRQQIGRGLEKETVT